MLTDQEKVMVRYHLGYANVEFVYTFVMGIGQSVPYTNLIEGAFDKILPGIEAKVRQILDRLEQTECTMFENQDYLTIDKIAGIDVRRDAQLQFRNAYQYWQLALAGIFSCIPNPADIRFGPGGNINVPVQN